MSTKIKKAKRKGLAGFMDEYNNKPTGKGFEANTALKSVVDVIIGVPIGGAIGAMSGVWSVPIGFVLLAGGHYFKDKSGLIRIAGASAIGYGIAKAIENKDASKSATVNGLGATEAIKTRLSNFKDEVMAAYYLDRIFKKEPATKSLETEDGAVGEIDLSAMDIFDEFNQQEADEFAQLQAYDANIQLPEFGNGYTNSENGESVFGIIDSDDEPDFSDY
jgi:hypothetical protein